MLWAGPGLSGMGQAWLVLAWLVRRDMVRFGPFSFPLRGVQWRSRGPITEATRIGGEVPTNGADEGLSLAVPYVASVTIVGTADLLFHRWDCDGVAEKAAAPKGSKSKKMDVVENYVYRDKDDVISLPGEYLRQSVIHAAKFRQDPRSPRKSAMDLYKAGVLSLTVYAPLGKDKWDYEHRCRALVQRNAVTRVRPAFLAGWEARLQLLVNVPEYIRPDDLHDVLSQAGKLVGVGDFRPTYGRFRVTSYEVGLEA